MRIDKFLWCVRIFKTRAQAKEACVAGKVWVNGDLAKPSRLVGEDDVIKVRKQAIDYEYEVLDIPKSRVGPALVEGLIERENKECVLEIVRMRGQVMEEAKALMDG